MTKINKVCERCGSTEVSLNATVRWDLSSQKWVITGIFEDAYCDDCQDESGIVDKELK